MKKMKRLAALFLAVVMIMAMGMTAMAEGNKTITIANPQPEKTYTAYKIFTATTGNGHTAYRLDDTSAAYGLLTAEATAPKETDGVTITETTVTGVYNVSVTDAPKFAEYLRENESFLGTPADTKAAAALAEGETSVAPVELSVADEGYYFINTTSGSLTNLGTVGADGLTIYDKNEKPTIEKKTTLTSTNVEVGQPVPYEISGEVPSLTGYKVYNYNISDKMNNGLTFTENTLMVKVGEKVLYENGNKTSEGEAWGNDFTVSIPGTNGNTFDIHFNLVETVTTNDGVTYTARAAAKAPILVQYSAVVNKNAITVTGTENPLENKATLVYSNNPGTNETGTTDSNVELTSANIIVDKYVGFKNADGTDGTPVEGTQRLAKAEFALKNADGKYYHKDDTTGAVTWVANLNGGDGIDPKDVATKILTDSEGTAKFEGIKDDATYELIETAAPAGYNLLTAPVSVKVEKGGTGTAAIVNKTEPVANWAGAVLPSTGGIGTTIFYVVGGIMVLGAGVLLITKKRMSAK